MNEKIEKYYYPILAYDKNESKDKITALWNSFDLLSEANQEKVSSIETARKVKAISLSFQLAEKQSFLLSKNIRLYFFNELSFENLPHALSDELGINQSTAQNISDTVIQKIINDNSQEIAHQAQFVKLSLSEALKNYPETGEQLITSAHIKLRNFPEPVRPSIKNWLSDYTYDSGYNKHNAMERGTFLFRNENSRELNSADREKLGYILKAYDENIPVSVNTNTNQLLFPQKTFSPAPAKPLSPVNLQPSAPVNFSNNSVPPRTGLNFTSPQKMSFESQPANRPTTIQNTTQNYIANKKPLPKNLVNLKEDF